MPEGSGTGELPIQHDKTLERKFTVTSDKYIPIELPQGEDILLRNFQPILSEADVISEIGVHLGELIASVQLPYKEGLALSAKEGKVRSDPNLLYCFKSTAGGSKHQLPKYMIIGAEQIAAMMRGEKVSKSEYLELSKKGQQVEVGRKKWMPGVGKVIPDDAKKQDELYRRSPAVSGEQGIFTIGDFGELQFKNTNKNPVFVGRGFVDNKEKSDRIAAYLKGNATQRS